MRIGIRDGCLGLAAMESFAVAAELGFDGIEVCIGGDYAESLLWQDGGAEQMKAAADAAGVAVSSLSPGVFARQHPMVEDPALRAEGRAMLGQCIALCGPLASRDILVPMFPGDFGTWGDAEWAQMADGFADLAAQAEAAGVTLGLETTFDADSLIKLLDLIACPAVGVYYDTANTTSRGYDAPAELRKLGDRVSMIHVKDTDGQHLGEGRVPFDDVKAAIADIGYNGWLILETPRGDDPIDSARRNLAFTRTLC